MSDMDEPTTPLLLHLINAGLTPAFRTRRNPGAVFDRLLARAQRGRRPLDAAGLAVVEPLRPLLAEYASVPHLSPLGWRSAQDMVGDRLRNYAAVADLRAAHPAIRDEPVTAPVFVVGLPRSGTTLTYSMLARSAANRGPKLWELQNVGLAVDDATRDRRIAEARRRYAILPRISPQWLQIHPLDPAGEEEDTFVRLHSELHGTAAPLPRYQESLRSACLGDDYLYLREVLQVLSHGRPPARWVLKHPANLWRLPEIRRAFPDARFVWTHRAPEVSVASYCSLAEAGQRLFLRPGKVDLHAIGEQWLTILSDGARRARAQRADLPADAVVDVVYDDLVADPGAVLRGVFDRLGMPWTEHDDAGLAELTARRGHTGHHYSPERYGLTAERIREAFAIPAR